MEVIMIIRKATVLGAGNMGTQIAALLVNAGVSVQLLDVMGDPQEPDKLSKEAYKKIIHPKKGLLYDLQRATAITCGNFTDDLKGYSDADIFIEAVAEELPIKQKLWRKVAKIAKKTAILATNTSGIPIDLIAKGLPLEAQQRFLGLHFFNPPQYMKLIEIIPQNNTSSEVIHHVEKFSIETLGKGVVHANDVSGFVANRIGMYTFIDIMKRSEQEGLSINEVDALTGKIIGRPKIGTYHLADLVGLDISYRVAKGMMNDTNEQGYFSLPERLVELIKKGNLGNKTKQGFYKKEGKTILMYDERTSDYVPCPPINIPFLSTLSQDLTTNLQLIFDAKDVIGQFVWKTIANILYYSAINVPKAANDFKEIDRAMIWGYNWKMGPFQIWDAIGFEKVKIRLEKSHGELPEWIKQRQNSFYGDSSSTSHAKCVEQYTKQSLWNHPQVSELTEVEKNLLLFVIRTPNNSLTTELSRDLSQAVATLENQDYRGMVITASGDNFGVGANLIEISELITKKSSNDKLSTNIDFLHQAVKDIKYANKPIVTAVRGRALGGSAELLLYSPFVVAAAESYIGLVEAGVGLIPSGGGLAELAERVYMKTLSRGDKIKALQNVLRMVSFAKVSRNASEAKEMGFLRETDKIIQNEELIVDAALKKADLEASYNFIPNVSKSYCVAGSNFYALAQAELETYRNGGFATSYDCVIGEKIAYVLSGGNVPMETEVDQQYLMSLEKEGFTSLSKQKSTLERVDYMLKHKKTLRN